MRNEAGEAGEMERPPIASQDLALTVMVFTAVDFFLFFSQDSIP